MTQTATGTAQANLAVLRKGYEAFQSGNMDQLRDEIFDKDIVWHSPGRGPLAGDFRGADAVIGLFVKQFEMTNGTFKVDVHDFLANDDHAVALGNLSAERDGKSLTSQYAHVCHFRDGKLAEAWIVNYDPQTADEFFA
ncbi:MAG: nuclear transport factor 2 family protein [Candidatus Dormibacteraeota bacterium]|nr:nuclear transport factor 2 family protein [Candidatus Dormibacteraeota bacterium]